ncbi:glycosyltransferase [Buchananella hordeovulneris]|uniref:Uncharacterized protein n=1 Tax=Buchananella hordeovulneris TaxID=52770 RepID=A0A1Q5PTF9_9ACTO|nr:glycosyltransferase [Buchananella hordeovulneris]OKL50887.1 hypothetical protein BSZ40_10170 [Buchananella hordeovulneris]
MARHALIVFTDHYPYEVGDEFFEQEIAALAANFDKVLVVPVLQRQGARLTRALPVNVSSRLAPRSRSADWRRHALKWTLPVLWRHRDMVESWPWRGLWRWIIDMRFATTALELERRLRRVISPAEFAKFDTVTFYSYWFYTGAAIGALWKKGRFAHLRPALYARAHAYDVDEADTQHGYLPARPFLLENCDEVWPISQYAAAQLERHCPAQADKLRIRRLGVPFLKTRPRRLTAPLQIVSCSHMAAYKRVDLLVDAVAELGARGRAAAWTHVGEFVPERLAKMRAYAERTIRGVKWQMLGRLDNAQVHDLYANTDFAVFVNTSSSEGVPVSIMEAFAAGLPVVATDAGGTREIVHDGVNGFLVPVAATPGQIADALERVAGLTQEEYAAMSAAARETWRTLANAEAQYQDVADSLLAAAQARAERG